MQMTDDLQKWTVDLLSKQDSCDIVNCIFEPLHASYWFSRCSNTNCWCAIMCVCVCVC